MFQVYRSRNPTLTNTCNRHLIIVNYAYDQNIGSPAELIEQFIMQTRWAEACVSHGVQVTVFQRFNSDHQLRIKGVNYVFVKDSLNPLPSFYSCAISINRKIKNYIKSVREISSSNQVTIHIHALIFPTSIFQLLRGLDASVHCIIQHHAESPKNKLLCWITKLFDSRIKHYFFTTKWHAEEWVRNNAITESKVAEIMECSSDCKPSDKIKAQQETNLSGQPLLLWTANLNSNKDPITILSGFERFSLKYPDAKLLMIYRGTQLLDSVQQKITNSVTLQQRVNLIGEIKYDQIGAYFNAADIFVQGSSNEGSGIAILDAIACGCIPVITKIPSFIKLTDNSSIGKLWSIGNSNDFCDSLLEIMQNDLSHEQENCRSLFQKTWTFDAITKKSMSYYFDLQR